MANDVKALPVVAWANFRHSPPSYVPYRTREHAEAGVRQSEIAATQEGPYSVVALTPLSDAESALSELRAEVERLRDDLRFVERWASHHGQKPSITPAEVLSVIQHYPPIKQITLSYADGKAPDTPNPFARADTAEARLERARGLLDLASQHVKSNARLKAAIVAFLGGGNG